MYNQCHNLVLGEIADAVRQKLPPSARFSADLKPETRQATIPTSTQLRKDHEGSHTWKAFAVSLGLNFLHYYHTFPHSN